MSDLISREALLQKIDELSSEFGSSSDAHKGIGFSREVIDEVPAVEAVEVVRCKDCKSACESSCNIARLYCSRFGKEAYFVRDDFYCADGHKKDVM